MKKLHKNSQTTEFDPKEGRCEFLCNNSNSVHRPFLGSQEINGLNDLGSTLRRISTRLVQEEGYSWHGGMLLHLVEQIPDDEL